ncbi:MAG: carboxypeptidase regulatory-like domain-containing protein [Gammaproteobacteria bacterium]|nr:MAG: carboxypeptidase regulatory-like domain-containing protein [Gammaproteobacteria bacterium]
MRRQRVLIVSAIGLALVLVVLVPNWPTQSPPITGSNTRAPGQAVTPGKQSPKSVRDDSPGEAAPKPVIVVSEKSAEPGISLRGWVGDVDGSGVGGIEIEIESRGLDGEQIVTQRARTTDNGDFLLQNVVPGRQYKLLIMPQRDYAAHSLDSFTTDNAAALKKIVLQRIILVDVEGMIVDTSMAPIPDFELMVRNLAVEYPDRVIRSDSTGYFRLPAFPAGELRIATNASDYYRIKGIELRPDEYRNLTLMIDRGNYHLSGWVGDENGVPLAQAQLTLKSAFAKDGYHSNSYRTAVTDDGGNFEFSGLGGHRSTLGIYARGYESQTRYHDFESFSDTLEIRLQRQD